LSPLDVRPKRALGQHFLADRNVLHVIGRLAELGPEDAVLEVGAGTGVLTRYLAERVAVVHAIELDRALEGTLRSATASCSNVHLLFGDAQAIAFGDLSPVPSKLVANLPYSIATPLVVESLDRLPEIERWCVMVQREVADRLIARPGTRSYGAVSVLVQLTAERAGFHPISRTCFRPPPNVDSALVALRRTRVWGSDYAALKRLVQGAFSHRRKTLANALELSGIAPRARVAAALVELDHPADSRAGALEPGEYPALAALLE
jgi:16S rRNA (adenine1518-N6/adenine1519-N6)-dimethyltransferase